MQDLIDRQAAIDAIERDEYYESMAQHFIDDELLDCDWPSDDGPVTEPEDDDDIIPFC